MTVHFELACIQLESDNSAGFDLWRAWLSRRTAMLGIALRECSLERLRGGCKRFFKILMFKRTLRSVTSVVATHGVLKKRLFGHLLLIPQTFRSNNLKRHVTTPELQM